MIRLFKIILTGLFLSIFAAQAVLACVCEVDMVPGEHHANMTHDHHKSMDHGHDGHVMDHDCEGNCHLSFEEQEGSDFVAAHTSAPKIDKTDVFQSIYHFELNDVKPNKGLIAFSKRQNLPPPLTLHSQGILLLI